MKMQITEIYDKYKIMPQLQEHQFRVAAVAEIIAKNMKDDIDAEAIIIACLLHDMGNILKFDLTVFPENVQPEGRDYWEKVKADLSKKYQTSDEYTATRRIAEELGVSDKALTCLDAIGFRQISRILHSGSIEQKICCYSDQRVDPYGIVSIDERIEEGGKRYGNSERTLDNNSFEKLFSDLKSLEKEIFSQIKITPTDISDDPAAKIIRALKNYSV